MEARERAARPHSGAGRAKVRQDAARERRSGLQGPGEEWPLGLTEEVTAAVVNAFQRVPRSWVGAGEVFVHTERGQCTLRLTDGGGVHIEPLDFCSSLTVPKIFAVLPVAVPAEAPTTVRLMGQNMHGCRLGVFQGRQLVPVRQTDVHDERDGSVTVRLPALAPGLVELAVVQAGTPDGAVKGSVSNVAPLLVTESPEAASEMRAIAGPSLEGVVVGGRGGVVLPGNTEARTGFQAVRPLLSDLGAVLTARDMARCSFAVRRHFAITANAVAGFLAGTDAVHLTRSLLEQCHACGVCLPRETLLALAGTGFVDDRLLKAPATVCWPPPTGPLCGFREHDVEMAYKDWYNRLAAPQDVLCVAIVLASLGAGQFIELACLSLHLDDEQRANMQALQRLTSVSEPTTAMFGALVGTVALASGAAVRFRPWYNAHREHILLVMRLVLFSMAVKLPALWPETFRRSEERFDPDFVVGYGLPVLLLNFAQQLRPSQFVLHNAVHVAVAYALGYECLVILFGVAVSLMAVVFNDGRSRELFLEELRVGPSGEAPVYSQATTRGSSARRRATPGR